MSINFAQVMFAQTKIQKQINQNSFDIKAAYEQAKSNNIPASEINGYVQFLKNDFSSKKALKKQSHKHTPYEGGSINIQETIIYLEPNKPMSLGCPNMGFEQYNFNNWTGGIGETYTVSGGTTPSYSTTGTSIINSAGDNASLINTSNYHTIMSIAPTNPVYPNCVGYDSIACKAIGSQTISQIPFISPFSFDPVSVRLNGALANNRACKLKYVTTASSSNKRLSYSYALVFHDPSATVPPHTAGEAPYFKVTVKNETTNTELPGCTSYTFNPVGAQISDSLVNSVTSDPNDDPVLFRKWNYYSVDLSSLSPGTLVSINFEVGGCTLGGHYSYAYVDAECGGIGTPYSNMCSDSTFASLIAPTGFYSYEWIGPSGTITGETNDTLIINPATPGTTYTINMISPGGCVITQTVSIGFTTVNIINLNATSSCAGGNSGTASVLASGSNGAYTYTWTNTNTGLTVSNSQTAIDLAPGSYSVLVAGTCGGQQSANLSIGVSPPFFFSQIKLFCGDAASIIQPGGSDYTWYHNSTIIPDGTNDTLIINTPINNDIYTLVYKNAQGCRDSLAYKLNQTVGGNVYFSNIVNVCPGDNNGSALINLNPVFPAPYNYSVTGPTNQSVITNTTNTTTIPLSTLASGIYTVVINDGICIYNNTVIINPIETNFTVSPTHSVLCFPEEAIIDLSIDDTNLSCGINADLCSGEPTQLFTSGSFTQNGSQTYPTVYGNYFTYGRSQYLVKKSELNSAGVFAGKISSLAFNVLDLNGGAISYPDFSIKMGCTSLTALPNANTIDQPFIAGLQTVYSNANQPISLGWLTHNFDQTFVWDGTSNILVEVCFSFPGTFNYTENATIQLKQVSYIANMYRTEDLAPVCGGSQPANNNNHIFNGASMLPNMRFGYCGAIPPANSYTVDVSPNGAITANYTNDSIKVAPTFTIPPNGSVIYTISVTNPTGGCITTKTVEILYPALTPTITSNTTNDTICEGGNALLTASGAVNYNWYYLQSGTLIPLSTSSSSINVTPPAIGLNNYIVTGYGPCITSTPDTNTITVNVIQITNLIVTPIPDVTKCLNTTVVLNTQINSTIPGNPGTPYVYTWTTLPGDIPATGNNTNSNYIVNSNSTTTLVVTVNGVCANSIADTIVVKNFIDDLAILITDSSTTCANTPFTLNTATNGGRPIYNYSWYIIPNINVISTNSNLAYISPETEGTYTVAVIVNDSCGYNKTDYEVIIVLPPCNIIIPNIITPNGDNANEFFKIYNIEHHPNTSITIFDRWGIKVYENPDYHNEWKADGVGDGTYFYIINVPDDKSYSGFVTVFKAK
jgi:gliding motility-associated-like protein